MSAARPEATPILDPPREVREIARALEDAGYETWCVGGAVRDALLGLPHLDWDLATSATPPQVRRIFRRTIPVGEEFGTIGVLDGQGRLHEVTTFRRDVQTDGRHAVVEFGASLDEDLARRDFTINAIAYSPRAERIHDPFGGRQDLAHGVVRAVGVARDRMVEDRLRALRALRFAGRFGFRIEPSTWAAIVESAPFLPRLSRERVKQELEKTLEQVARPSGALALWRRSGALRTLIPSLDGQPEWMLRATDVVARPDAVRDAGRRRRRTLLRLATLFVGREGAGVTRTLRDLRFANRDADWVGALVAHAWALREPLREALKALEALEAPEARPPSRDATYRRWAAAAGRTRVADVLRVALATLAAEAGHGREGRGGGGEWPGDDAPAVGVTHVRAAARAARALYGRVLRVAYRDPVEIADLAVDGEDLLRDAGATRGPALGLMLRRLRDAVVDDPTRNNREALLAMARGWAPDAARED